MAIKTNIKDIPVANDRLVYETALENGVEEKQVLDIVKHLGYFTAATMKAELMQAVMIPGWGKFKPKQSLLKSKHKVAANRRNGMDMLYRAAKGFKVQDNREPDETI
jgi:hypothetical protein